MKTIQIINHFGLDNQLGKLKEELLELMEVIKHYDVVAAKFASNEALIDELADVKLLIKQVEEYLDIKKKVGERVFFKYNRTLDRIDTGFYA